MICTVFTLMESHKTDSDTKKDRFLSSHRKKTIRFLTVDTIFFNTHTEKFRALPQAKQEGTAMDFSIKKSAAFDPEGSQAMTED